MYMNRSQHPIDAAHSCLKEEKFTYLLYMDCAQREIPQALCLGTLTLESLNTMKGP